MGASTDRLHRLVSAPATWQAPTPLGWTTTAVAWFHLTLAGALAWAVGAWAGADKQRVAILLTAVALIQLATAVTTRGFRRVTSRTLYALVAGVLATWVVIDILLWSISFPLFVIVGFAQLMLTLALLAEPYESDRDRFIP